MPDDSNALPVALVTGGARRIGRAIALDLAQAGWSIAVHYRGDPADAKQTVADIERSGARAVTIHADLADTASSARLVSDSASLLGPVTCLINNASVFEFDTAANLNAASLGRHLSVNLAAPLLLSQAFQAQLPSTAAGCIVNIIDQRVWSPTPEFFSYSLSKSALWQATRMLAQAFSPRIRVNAIGPGPALRSVHQTQQEFEAEARSTILGRGTNPAEICRAVRFILDAPAMTGQMIALDGGQHLRWFPEVTPGEHDI